MTTKFFLLSFSLLITAAAGAGGRWQVLQKSIGVSAMHMQLLRNDRVIMFDRTNFGKSNLSLPRGICRRNPNDTALKVDCTAHSVEYDVASNSFRPLMLFSDSWCSSGSVSPNGSLVQTGGWHDGELRVRLFEPCSTCDWVEIESALAHPRWYATNHLLPDGRIIIVGGRAQPNFEFFPKIKEGEGSITVPFLEETKDAIEDNLYPFVFLNVDGNLFIYANNRAILLNYVTGETVKTYPTVPGDDPRSYPSTGSAVLLPLKVQNGTAEEAQVLVCGGAPLGSYNKALNKRIFLDALNTCARMTITDPNPQWTLETMPGPRVMADMTLLPDGNVLIINGASQGTAGWDLGREPVLKPVLYKTENPADTRFKTMNPTSIPRMYHSTAVLLRDGRVLVGGSNPHKGYEFSSVLFPTELSVEAFYPEYLNPEFSDVRPTVRAPKSQQVVGYGQKVQIEFSISGKLAAQSLFASMISPSFSTHSFSMNQRSLLLPIDNVVSAGNLTFQAQLTMPSDPNLAPSSYFLLFVVHQNIPSEATWIRIA
ncbi:aldehyde oxidase GLOX-like [Rosa sericea]